MKGREGEGRVSLPFLFLEVVLAIAVFPPVVPAPLNISSFLVVITHIILCEIPRVHSDFLNPYQ